MYIVVDGIILLCTAMPDMVIAPHVSLDIDQSALLGFPKKNLTILGPTVLHYVMDGSLCQIFHSYIDTQNTIQYVTHSDSQL